MRCGRCGFELHDEWGFCPRCGARKGGDPADIFGRDIFSQILNSFKDSFKRFEEMDKLLEKDMEAWDLSPHFERAKKKAFGPVSIHVTTRPGRPPSISIKTRGDVDREKLEREIQNRLGVPGKPCEDARKEREKRIRFPIFKKKPAPGVTEEPKAEVKRIGDKVKVDINMPDVESAGDVEIKELESSVEVRAMGGSKAYFKILTKPARFRLTGQSFRDGVLHLEFS